MACSGQIDMAETHDNGHVYDKLLKKKKDRVPSRVKGLYRVQLHGNIATE